MRRGAARNMTAPVTMLLPTIIRMLQEKILSASKRCFLPRHMEMGTEEPTPIMSASAKLMITNGMARLRAANAVSPKNRPTRIPSNVWYREEASMLIMPGMEARKNSLTGGVFEKSAAEFILQKHSLKVIW